MKKVDIYTDGACSGNPGKGGWACILIYNQHEKVLSGGELTTTNNRMELLAVINALDALKEKCIVDIYSDSSYVVNPFIDGYYFKWQMNDWRKTANSKEQVKNVDLWQRLSELLKEHTVSFHKVKGHSDNEYNNRCDQIAKKEIAKLCDFN